MFISLQKHSCEIIMRCVMNFQQRTDDNLSLEYFNLKDKNTIISNIPSSSYPCHLRISKRVEPLLCTSHPFQSWPHKVIPYNDKVKKKHIRNISKIQLKNRWNRSWCILAVNTPESLLCCLACAKFSQNCIHSIRIWFLHWKKKKRDKGDTLDQSPQGIHFTSGQTMYAVTNVTENI